MDATMTPEHNVKSGSYRGTADGLVVDVRVERGADGTPKCVGGDVISDDAFVTSFVGVTPADDGPNALVAPLVFRGHSELSTGSLRLDVDARGIGAFQLSVDLEGDHRDVVAGRLEWQGTFLRRLDIEIDGLEGTEPPVGFTAGTALETTLQNAYEKAGFQVTVRVDPFVGRPSESVRMRGWTLAEIHRAMESMRGPRAADRLCVHLFVCSFMQDKPGVLGIMYDFGSDDLNASPREGVAVFHDHPMLSDPRVPEALRKREYVFTCVHEIGHALNLAHSFDKGRPSALSWMNYPDLFPRGLEAAEGYDGSEEFWRRFPRAFDEEEQRYLGFATLREIRPGGLPFGVYEEGVSSIHRGGAVAPRRTRLGANPLRATRGMELVLEPTKKGAYHLGEPVLAAVQLRNVGGSSMFVPRGLDPSDGYVTLHVRRPSGDTVRYRPPVTLCQEAAYQKLEPGEATRRFDHLPLFLSAQGPVFNEPGTYEVRADVTGIDGGRVAYAKPVRIDVLSPDRTTEKVARTLFERRDFLRALYLRHPLSARGAWNDVEKTLDQARAGLAGDNSLAAYVDFVAALGWASEFAERREASKPASLEKARERIERAEHGPLEDLPSAVTRLAEALRKKPKRATKTTLEVPFKKPLSEIAPSGLFGSLGLDAAPEPRAAASPFERIVTKLAGTRSFADVVSWNIEHLHSERQKIRRVADLIRSFRCDFWGLQEVDEGSLRELVDALNASGRVKYDFRVVPGKGQQSGALFRIDTTTVRVLEPPQALFDDELTVSLTGGGTAKRDVFFRMPLLCDVRVKQGSNIFDFRAAVVHLKSTDMKLKDRGDALRLAGAKALGKWIAEDRGNVGERDYLVMGDMNAETAQQGLKPFADDELSLLSVGMQEKFGSDQALTRVATKRLLDHIVITQEALVATPAKDKREQTIIRSDLALSDFTQELSDHIPVAVRFSIGPDADG